MSASLKKSLLLLIGSCSSFITYWALKTYLIRRRFKHIPGPPTKGVYGFFFGNLTEVIQNQRNGGMFFELMSKWYLFDYFNIVVISNVISNFIGSVF